MFGRSKTQHDLAPLLREDPILPPLVSLGIVSHTVYNRGKWDVVEIEQFYDLRRPSNMYGRSVDGGPITPIFDTTRRDPEPVKHRGLRLQGFNSGNHDAARSDEVPRRYELGPGGLGRPQTSAHGDTLLDHC